MKSLKIEGRANSELLGNVYFPRTIIMKFNNNYDAPKHFTAQ